MVVRVTGWLIIFCITVLSIGHAYMLLKQNGSVDLRCRIIGTRLSGTTHSPYYYKWKEGDDVRLLDPNAVPGRAVNGNVVTPAVYRLFYFLALPGYETIKAVWAILQYLFLFGSMLLLAKKKSFFNRGLLPVIMIAVCYLYSNIWFYNIERGQMYSFYLFIFSVLFRLAGTDWKYGRFFLGFVNVAAVFVRPLMLVFLFAGVVKPGLKWLAGCICGAAAGFLIFVLPVIPQWKDYFTAMNEYSLEMNGKQYPLTDTRILPVAPDGSAHLQVAANFNCGGLSTVQYYLAARGIHTGTISLVLGYCLVAGCCCLLFLNKALAVATKDEIFIFCFLLYILAELFIIGYRGGYNQVEWIFAVFLICRKNKTPYWSIGMIVVALLLENVYLGFWRYQFEFAEIILLGILFYLLMIRFPASEKKKFAG